MKHEESDSDLGSGFQLRVDVLKKSYILKIFLTVFVLFFSITAVHANSYAVKFEEHALFPDFTIEVSKHALFPDETWKIVGSCSEATSYSTVQISEHVLFPDLTVEISQHSMFPDKEICIKNPDSLPDWFIEMIN